MKKLLISSAVAGVLMGATVVYADDAHHPEQAGAPVTKPTPVKSTPSKQPATPDKTMSNTGDTGAADAQMVKAQERMKQAQALMTKLRDARDPAGRKELMQQHTQALRDAMGMMRDMKNDGHDGRRTRDGHDGAGQRAAGAERRHDAHAPDDGGAHGDDADDDGTDVRASGYADAEWKITRLVLAQQMRQEILKMP